MAASEATLKDGVPTVMDYTPSSAQLGGQVIVSSDLIGVENRDESANQKSAIIVESGIHEVTGDAAIAKHKYVWWDDTAKKVTETPRNNKFFGITVTACGGDTQTCRVLKLHPTPSALGEILDLNGVADALVLDADGDTTISAPTDDQIDIEIAGADDFTFTANRFNVLTGSAIDLADSCSIVFGTGDDISVNFDGTNLVIATAVADTGAVEFGADDLGVDVIFYAGTTTEKVTWDQSADKFIMTANVQITGQGSTLTSFIPSATQQALSGAGAVNITSYYTAWTTTGADAGTLADGAQLGQLKKIQMVGDSGDGTLTPATFADGTSITFADVGDFVILRWTASGWTAIELGNMADGTSAPTVNA